MATKEMRIKQVPEDLFYEFKVLCARERKSVNDMLLMLLKMCTAEVCRPEYESCKIKLAKEGAKP